MSAHRSSPRSFSRTEIDALSKTRILGVRSGPDHRYTGVWVIVADDRVFVRSWNDKPTGWYRAFRREPLGSVQVGGDEIPVRARPVRSERIQRAVSGAYARKYPGKASEKWVRGLAEPAREATTIELVRA